MRTILSIILVLAAIPACSSDPIDTEEECLEAGGHVVVSTGGQVKCPEGEEEIGQIPGFEPIICCR